jgi:hypothetical protein
MADEPISGRCNAKTKDGEYCQAYPTKDDDGEIINGRCYSHGGHPDAGRPGEGNPVHGVKSDRSHYYQNLSSDQQAWIDRLLDSFLDDAPFSTEDTGKVEILRQVCIDIHKRRSANEYIQSEGLAQECVIDSDEDGNPVEGIDENVLNLPYDRLGRSVTKVLKDLGITEDPESAQADATRSLVDLLSFGLNSEEEDDSD